MKDLEENKIRIMNLTIDTCEKEVYINNEWVCLPNSEYYLLETLAENMHRLMPTKALLEELLKKRKSKKKKYNRSLPAYPDKEIIRAYISRLRLTLEKVPVTITSVRGKGYYLQPSVRPNHYPS